MKPLAEVRAQVNPFIASYDSESSTTSWRCAAAPVG